VELVVYLVPSILIVAFFLVSASEMQREHERGSSSGLHRRAKGPVLILLIPGRESNDALRKEVRPQSDPGGAVAPPRRCRRPQR
jgi:hypothetical protein